MSASHQNLDDHFSLIPVGTLELSDSVPAPSTNASGQISLLVTLHGVPLGVLDLLEGGPPEADLRARALTEFRAAVLLHLRGDGLTNPKIADVTSPDLTCRDVPEPLQDLVTVVVCTLGEDPRLQATVASILAQTSVDLELVVVDNQPSVGKARRLLADVVDSRLRIVDEPRRGLSAARNAGVRAARGAIVAFTDDDAYAERDWVARLVGPFAIHRTVVCTTGLVLPAELATPAQLWFEEFGAFDKGFDRTLWCAGPIPPELATTGQPGTHGPLFPYSAGVYGSGNNMAFRRDWLVSQPLFDEALGAGSLSRGGEDLDAFLSVMLDQKVLVYEPRALVRHHARRDMTALRQQMYGYGSGMAAVIAKHAVRPRRALQISRMVPAGLRKLLDQDSEKNAGRSNAFPTELSRAELKGFLVGPLLYFRARRRLRR